MFLTETEIKELTHRKRRSSQLRALKSMGVEHKPRPDGSIAVLKKHVEHLFGMAKNSDDPDESELNWDDAKIPAKVRK